MIGKYVDLNPIEKKHYDKFLRAIQQGDNTVFAPGIFKINIVQRIITVIAYEHPEIFYVDFQHIRCTSSPTGIIYYIRYTVRPAMRESAIRNMEVRIKEIQQQIEIKHGDTTADICRKVHNFLVKHVRYNYNALRNPDKFPEAFTITGVFEQREAVCEGIAKAFMLLAERAGVKVYLINGTSSREGLGHSVAHVWNIVKIDNNYAHIDVTWDLSLSETSKIARYDYFMIPDEWIKVDHDFSSTIKCLTDVETFFARKRCLIDGSKILRNYLERELKNKSSKLYFKIVGENGIPNDITSKVQKMVEKMVAQYSSGTYSIVMVPNIEQNVFFFRIE